MPEQSLVKIISILTKATTVMSWPLDVWLPSLEKYDPSECTGFRRSKGDDVLNEIENFRQLLLNGLRGRGSHVSPETTFEGLAWNMVKTVPDGSSHSIWQLLVHMVYWQEFSLALLRDETPDPPEHAADTWTEELGPTNESEWSAALNTFLGGIDKVENLMTDLHKTVAAREGRSRAEVIGMLVGHNSYHLGQIVLLRQMLGTWPPASGGDTW